MKNQVILITGSSSGIGRETAYRFASEGAKLVLTYYKGKTRGERVEKKCRGLGAADTLLINLNVMDNKSIASTVVKVQKKYGRIDLLINNAGTGVFLPLKDQTVRDIEIQLRTNLEGLIKVTRAFLPFIRKGIINIASFLGKHAGSELATYCASKYGVRGFTQSVAEEYPGLIICSVNPDETATHLTGYSGRPPSEVADVIFRAASGKIRFKSGGDVDVWKILK
ncbi:MAG: SDR family NAD(P)-dependent oxidoreductase [Nitrospirae bacterium]|nr:SDR family NAD(P)-dependent oxidoreductase [Nitrospirota bacterium]